MSDDHEIRQHLERLEYRLDEYHERLVEAVAQRDELALDAAWGVTQAITLAIDTVTWAVISVGISFALAQFLSDTAAIGCGIVIFLIAQAVAHRRSWARNSKMRLEEKATLQSLPEWKSEAEKLW